MGKKITTTIPDLSLAPGSLYSEIRLLAALFNGYESNRKLAKDIPVGRDVTFTFESNQKAELFADHFSKRFPYYNVKR